MDDRNFDKQSAQIWIRAVEKNVKSWRDFYVYSKLNDMIRTTLATSIIDIGCGQGICSEKKVEPFLFLAPCNQVFDDHPYSKKHS